ncbi:hypothetical protein B0A71_14490 [Flavobacterium tructae]|uniref:Uncharacterized protein n=1 Tax=Flavobacterium tructae TaxID=1114873 RepID=A0ABX4D522_9FLAO|nr:hypothetical protein B0A71_14490 [Flavobacterium tructae]
MIEFHADLGGLYWWILIRFCKTKLASEQGFENRRRNLFFLTFLNFLVLFLFLSFCYYKYK